MSEAKNQGEENIAKLLAHADDPPRIRPAARERIWGAMKARRTALIGQERERVALRSNRRVLIGIALAASVMLLLTFGRQRSIVHANDGASPVSFTLEDGTNVVLDRGAEVVERGDRHLRLVRGQAFLDVAHTGYPFIVDAPQGRVVVTGTLLVLDARENETRAAVARGEVRMEGASGSELLHAGDQGVLRDDARPTRLPAPRVSYLTSFARQAFEKEATGGKKGPIRHGTLIARDPRGWAGEYPLQVRDFTVDVHVDNGVARTTIDQTFFNHTSLQLEGVYSFPLPPGASIARLAMYVDGTLVEGGVVERQRGRDVYESIVYQRRDPALLEWMAGNVFKIRIFPLPARTEKRIVLSYTQTLEHLYDTYRLAVPIPELDAPVGHAQFQVNVVGGEAYDIASSSHDLGVTAHGSDRALLFEKSHYALTGDLLVTLREKTPEPVRAVRHGDYLMVRARPDLPPQSAPHKPRHWALLYDTSASRSPRDLEAQAFFATHLLAECDDADTYTVVAFDRAPRVLPGGMRAARDDASAVRAFLTSESRAGIGDTDLEAALSAALEKLGPPNDATESIIAYIGDGMATHGETRAAELAKRIGARAKFVGVTLGDRADTRLMQALAVATGGLSVSATAGDDLAWHAFDLVATLNTPRVLDVKSTLTGEDGRAIGGAIAYGPSQLAAGESAEVLVRLSSAEPARLALTGSIDGKPWSATFPIAAATGDASYLPRIWAQRRIDALMMDDSDLAHQKEEVTKLGLENFLLTPFTSLLVLENDAMYKSFDVRRSAPTDWARYSAPPTIKVAYEPVEHSNAINLGGTIVTRRATEVFGRSAYADDWSHGLREGGQQPDFFGDRLRFTTILDTTLEDKRRAFGRDEKPKEETESWTGSFGQGNATSAAIDLSVVTSPISAIPTTRSDTGVLGRLAPMGSAGEGRKSSLKKGFLFGGEMEETLTGAFRYSSDPRLDDLTELVPALFNDDLDLTSERLRAAAGAGEQGSITADARALLERARAVQKGGRYTSASGDVVIVSGGRYQHERTLPSGLTERTVYDGDSLVTSYPELELAVTRAVSAAEPELFARAIPFVLPSTAPLERFYRVDLAGPRTLRLRPIAKDTSAFEIELDEALHVVRVGDARVANMTLSTDPAEIDTRSSNGFVRISMPLRDDGYWLSRIGSMAPGSAEWTDAQRQLLATYAARGNEGGLAGILRAMREKSGGLRRGDLVLGSRGTRQLDMATLRRVVGKMVDPVVDFVVASRTFTGTGSSAALEHVADAHPRTLVGMLSRYRALLHSVERDASEAEQRTRLLAFGQEYPDPTLRFVAALDMTQRWSDPKAIAAVWDDLARDPAIGWHADAAAAHVFRNRGHYEQAAPRYQRAFLGALDAGEHPTINPSFRWVISSYTGEAGYRSFWARWRTRVLASNDPRALLSFLRGLSNGGGEEGDLSLALVSYESTRSDDPDLRAVLVTQLAAAGRTADAWSVLGRARTGNAELYALAATVADREGRLPDAARLTLRAMDALGDQPIGLGALRSSYQRLFDLYRRVVLAARSPEETAWAITGTLDAAARWRRDDPDNADIDKRCANLLFDAHRPAEAQRHLASITERHPADGASYADVAEVLERRGEDADAIWARAADVEPTNPTWLLNRAQNLLARGSAPGPVRELLERIDHGKWQPRFSNIQSQAHRLLESLPK